MAQFGISRSPISILALLSLLVFVGMTAYSVVTMHQLGGILYAPVLLAIVLGFASREDSVVMGGIIGLSLLVILDITLRIGALRGL